MVGFYVGDTAWNEEYITIDMGPVVFKQALKGNFTFVNSLHQERAYRTDLH